MGIDSNPIAEGRGSNRCCDTSVGIPYQPVYPQREEMRQPITFFCEMSPWWWLVAARPHNASELTPTPSWPMMAIPKLELLSIMSQLDHQKEGDDDGVLIASVM